MTPDEVKHHFKKFFGYELPQTQINVFSPEFIDFCLYISNHNQMGFEEWYEKISKWSEGTALDMSFSMKRHLASHLEEWQNSRPTPRALDVCPSCAGKGTYQIGVYSETCSACHGTGTRR